VPAVKSNILVQPGMRSLLNVSLANLFSSIQLVYPGPDERALMADDWKWVLRTSSATRPVLRFGPGVNLDGPQPHRASVFSDTRGVLHLSAGDGGMSQGSEGDLGTAFALATSLFGNSQLEFSGNVAYGASTGLPVTAFRTSYSRNVGLGSPEVSMTMRQLYMPGRFGAAVAGAKGSAPSLRSTSISFQDRAELSDALSLQYGFSLDSVSFLDRLNYFSPYARLRYTLGDAGEVDFTFTSGNARPDLESTFTGPSSELQRDLSSLARFPRVSLRAGRAKVQRGENFELGYTREVGTRTLRVGVYRESVTNAALTIAASDGLYASGDVLPDLFSGSSVFNAGDYQTIGYSASVTQRLGENATAAVIYSSMGVLSVDSNELVSQSPDELRAMIRAGRRHGVTVRTAATSPMSGTHLVASYQWSDHRWAAPGHMYSTQAERPQPGLNLYIRQPMPSLPLLPWRLEATADLRNLLAQGYIPLAAPGGRRVLLMQTPRAFRGGLSFIF
jgi:hypothetical protein